MPIYDYVCHACDHKFEEYKSISQFDATKKPACPKCHKKKQVERVFCPATPIVHPKPEGHFDPDKRWDELPVPNDDLPIKDGVIQIDHNDGRLL